ncbi:diaminohydroxyphosphoribosylaminopyrimidine deaminase [Ciceribacter lividus]|uniref:Riboflavin biosynthesis protein RibD n=1 Tax=Ciceribacter lividus TaxID=1197950 RepID=A0A6I7HPN3_9HYPH|nr:bifunctional diaminohydroxyphosphoribosylaminopyrimidine deaminase/5-amino-6-(5-phosphoribosylamino)uracil reductase RibD [Ciceribacter lividus]RCW27738.1 diaminohydroxyphosphoribosylaminopyrimidine deaminase [Ciceribacter lividus]
MDAASDDRWFMEAALRLALTHLGRTSTNPSVGCLIVKDGEVVGRGVTAEGGRPHAEPQALAEAGEKASGATAYVTLEPCSHYGRTPPCANAIVAAGIARVVISVLDPDPRVSGRGVKILEDAGIEVVTGVHEEEGRRALAAYLTRQIKKRPQVILKLAISSDGMIGRKGEGQIAITGPESREQVHVLRAETDAILVGIGTALADDPELTVRLPGLEAYSPVRVVLDRNLDLRLTSKLVLSARKVPVIAVAGEGSAESLQARRAALEAEGVEVVEANDLESLLFGLVSRGISSVLVEGGAKTARAFIEAGLVDRILLFHGPRAIGPGGIAAPVDTDHIPEGFKHVRSAVFGADRFDDYERGI